MRSSRVRKSENGGYDEINFGLSGLDNFTSRVPSGRDCLLPSVQEYARVCKLAAKRRKQALRSISLGVLLIVSG